MKFLPSNSTRLRYICEYTRPLVRSGTKRSVIFERERNRLTRRGFEISLQLCHATTPSKLWKNRYYRTEGVVPR